MALHVTRFGAHREFGKRPLVKQRAFAMNALSDISSEDLAASLFALSLFPYLGFLYYSFKTKETPKLVSVGFATLLIFVGVTAPAGIYAKNVYGTSLSNVDWLHGSAESFLSLTNLLIVLGLRRAIRSQQTEEQEQQ